MKKIITLASYALVLVVIVLLNSATGFHYRNQKHSKSKTVSNLQQEASSTKVNGSSEKLDTKSTSTPEEKVATTTTVAETKTVEDEKVRTVLAFNATSTLECVADYMQSTSSETAKFCPSFTKIPKSQIDNVEEELGLINVKFDKNLERTKQHYRDLREKLGKPTLGISDSEVEIAFTSKTFENNVSLNSVFQSVLGLSAKYSEVHEVLKVDDSAEIDAFG